MDYHILSIRANMININLLFIYVSLIKGLARAKEMMDPRKEFIIYSHVFLLLLILMDQFVNSSITSSSLYWF